MRKLSSIIAIAAICLLTANSVDARAFPGGGGSGGGRAAASGMASAIRSNRSGYQNYGDYGGANYVFSSGIQPQNYMQPGPSGSSQRPLVQPSPSQPAGPSQAQLNQDWWFQEMQQQTQQAAPSYSSAGYAPSGYASSDFGFEAGHAPPKVATDVIHWPVLLQRPTFAPERTEIEAPYRRTPPKLSVPTADDYRQIVKTAQDMKDVLEWLLRDGLQTDEYNQAEKFLTLIQQQARDRSQRREATSDKPKS